MSKISMVVRLGNVCDFFRGLTYSKADEVDWSTNVVLRANNIDVTTGTLDLSDLRYIRDEMSIPVAKKVRKDCLLICTASGSKKHLGKVALIQDDLDYAFGGFMGLLQPRDSVDPKYLHYILSSEMYTDFIEGLSAGVNINNLKFSQLAEFEFPLPPLVEQKRIVAILGEAFAGIEKAVANAEKNLANVRELFRSYMDEVFTRKGTDWAEVRLRDVCTLVNGRAYSKPELLSHGKYPVLRVGNFFSNRNWYYSDLELEPTKYCEAGDLLYAWSASFGPRIWDGEKVIYHYHIWRVDLKPDVTKEFLYYWFEWDAEKIKKELGAGTTMVHVSKQSMDSRQIALPSQSEQQQITGKIRELESASKRLEAIFQQRLTALTELQQSILRKAFAGELTAKEVEREMAAA